tara:strand:+ start:11562 stop:11957 length:396 start_codon:yes stop_codon:yes gene_type:complete
MKSLIRNSNQAKQGLDFTGVENGKIHPSDIDAVLEFNNEALILMEVKREGSKLPTGQRLLLERIADSWHTKKSIVLFITHNFKEDTKDIPLQECNVEAAYYLGQWNSTAPETLISVLNKIGKNWEIDKLSI